MKRDTAMTLARAATDPDFYVGFSVAFGYVALIAMHFAGWLS